MEYEVVGKMVTDLISMPQSCPVMYCTVPVKSFFARVDKSDNC